MIFLVFVIVMILGIGIKIVNAIMFKNDLTSFICKLFVSISGVIVLYMLYWIVVIQTTADGHRAMMEQRYNALICKSQAEIVSSEYIEEIQKWNEEMAKYQSYSNNIWIGIFYPERKYEGLEIIDLENIRIKD